MQKRLVQAASVAMLLATMAAPAYAKDRGNEGGRGEGLSASLKLDNGLHLGWYKNGKHDDDGDDDENGNAVSSCLNDAQQARDAALSSARDAARVAKEAGRTAYQQAVRTAQRAYKDASRTARVTFKASVRDEVAINAYATAKVKAETDWLKAVKAAQDAWKSVKVAADTALAAAKDKAAADFKVAQDKCATTTAPSTDSVAPAAVTNLSLSAATSSSIALSWTAPGDDNVTGTAASYDVRYSTSPIVTAADFTAATQASGEPVPAVAGTTQSMTVSGLNAATTYFFAIKAQDEVPNVSALSNVPSLATP